jgi:hypothetical protein
MRPARVRIIAFAPEAFFLAAFEFGDSRSAPRTDEFSERTVGGRGNRSSERNRSRSGRNRDKRTKPNRISLTAHEIVPPSVKCSALLSDVREFASHMDECAAVLPECCRPTTVGRLSAGSDQNVQVCAYGHRCGRPQGIAGPGNFATPAAATCWPRARDVAHDAIASIVRRLPARARLLISL